MLRNILTKNTVPAALACSLIVATGIVHGVVTERWGRSNELTLAAERLKQVPAKIGDWTSEEMSIDTDNLKIGGIDAYLSRNYHNRLEGKSVNVVIVCGNAGPISVHTPEVCFPSAGFEDTSGRSRYQVTGDGSATPGDFWVGTFTREEAGIEDHLRVFWSWFADEQWQVPDNPRIHFAGKRALFKMYVARAVHQANSSMDDDASVRFMRLFLPEFERTILQSE